MKQRVGIVGAGPGGLASAVLLASEGHQVDVFEAADRVGGRNSSIELGAFRFDAGPTFYLMPQILEEIFQRAGRKLSDFLSLKPIDPMYKLDFGNGEQMIASSDPYRMSEAIGRFSRKDQDRFWSFRERQIRKFEALLPTLKKPASKWSDLLSVSNLNALPFLDFSSVYDELKSYFEDERVRLAFTFQAKYLGMSPFECPSLFTILPHIEHSQGVWHPVGGCHQLSHAMARLLEELGGRIHLNSPVKRFVLNGTKVSGFEIADGRRLAFDSCVMNADFAHGMGQLFSDDERRRYKDAKLARMKYSCSTFMLYLGLNQKVPLEHHGIYFAQNYRKNLRELCGGQALSEDPSFYLHNPSNVDPSLAPEGKSALYVLVPVPNMDAGIDWEREQGPYRAKILAKIKQRSGIDLEPLIEIEKMITPLNWQNDYSVYKGATFNLAHSFDQLMQFRPHNESEEFRNFYIVGGGTHPGSGLPTILQSGIIAADLIIEKSLERKWWPAPRQDPAIGPIQSRLEKSNTRAAEIMAFSKEL